MSAAGPIAPSRAGCCGPAWRAHGSPTACPHPPTHAGLVWLPWPPPGELWWAFACTAHRLLLEAARPLTARDHTELGRRREHLRATVEDRAPWTPIPPLATGVEGRRRLARAVGEAETRDTR